MYKLNDFMSDDEIKTTLSKMQAQAQKEIDRAKQYLKENETALFEYHDLKLHDVASYLWRDFEKDFPLLAENSNADNEFNFYCETTFDTFQEVIKAECNADFRELVQYLGRTSKFYINDFSENYLDAEKSISGAIYDLFNNFDLWRGAVDLNDDANEIYISDSYTTDDNLHEYADEIADDLNHITQDFYNYVVEHCAPFIRCYEILKAFKDNQVSDFKEFCEQYETELQEQREKEIAQEKADNETITAIIKKYDITPDDVNTIINTIYSLKGDF